MKKNLLCGFLLFAMSVLCSSCQTLNNIAALVYALWTLLSMGALVLSAAYLLVVSDKKGKDNPVLGVFAALLSYPLTVVGITVIVNQITLEPMVSGETVMITVAPMLGAILTSVAFVKVGAKKRNSPK